ncbi:MAG: glycoside hydrolase family 5 protein [Paracoccaceae bacterium]|nr:glycoside hydrolase family 5 protein [Paracoccaceae bacterium]
MERPRNEGQWSYTIDPAHFRIIAAAGFDTVRFPVNAMDWFQYGQIDSRFLFRVEEVVDGLRAEGLNVILDVHGFKPINRDPDAHEDRLIAVWDQLAEAFAGYDDGLIFEILNEPGDDLGTSRVSKIYDVIIPRIRRLHPDRWIIIGGGNKSDEAQLKHLPDYDDRVAHTFHFYDPFAFTDQFNPNSDDNRKRREWPVIDESRNDIEVARRQLETAAVHHRTTLLGEFGVYDAAPEPDTLRWIRYVREFAEARGIGWCYWSFSGWYGIYDADEGRWLKDRLDALISQ